MAGWDEMFDARLDLHPPVADEQLSGLPPRRGVALLVGRDDLPLLMLPAADIRSRVAARLTSPDRVERSRMPNLHEVVRRVLWKLTYGHFETDLWFLELARAVWPQTYAEQLAWKPAWFVRVDPDDAYPHPRRTREVLAAGGLYLGPFVSARSAERFIGQLADAFDLCRDARELRSAPGGRRCSYGQMGRCLCPCDGTVSSERYRQAVHEAWAFAAGQRGPLRQRLGEQMREAADALRYEEAARLKATLERLAAFDAPDYAHVRPVEEFRYMLVQKGPGRRKAAVFLADRGEVRPAGPLEYPPKHDQLNALLAAMPETGFDQQDDPRANRLRLGLVAHYLFTKSRRAGLIVHLDPKLTLDALAARIEESAGALGLKAGRQAKADAAPGAPRGPDAPQL